MTDDELFDLLERQTTAGQCRALGRACRHFASVVVEFYIGLARLVYRRLRE